MDLAKIIARIKSLLLTPKTEWPVIAGESATTQSLLVGYALPVAALPAIAGFIKTSVLGYGMFGVSIRGSMGGGLTAAIFALVVSLVSVFVMGLIINALAPTFGGTKNSVQALKTACYAYTAGWVAGIFILLSVALGGLLTLLGMGYGAYLMYVGLPHTMKAPQEKAAGYAIVSILAAIVLSWVLTAMVAGLGFGAFGAMGGHGLFGSRLGGTAITNDEGSVTIDGGALGGLAALGKRAEQAGKQMEAAQKSGDTQAQAQAAGNMIGAVLGGGQQVESLSTEKMKSFLPATLAGMAQESSSAERNGAMGMQISEAKAQYGDGKRTLNLEITDMGSAKGLMGLASWVNIEQDKQTQTGYEKTYKQGENMIHEQWDNTDKRGEYSAMLAGRFMVKVTGNAESADALKSAVNSLNLAGLAALRSEGVKAAN
jgi:Yip1 domain